MICSVFTASISGSIIDTDHTIDNHVIEREDEIQDLGVILDRKFTFAAHIEAAAAIAEDDRIH